MFTGPPNYLCVLYWLLFISCNLPLAIIETTFWRTRPRFRINHIFTGSWLGLRQRQLWNSFQDHNFRKINVLNNCFLGTELCFLWEESHRLHKNKNFLFGHKNRSKVFHPFFSFYKGISILKNTNVVIKEVNEEEFFICLLWKNVCKCGSFR